MNLISGWNQPEAGEIKRRFTAIMADAIAKLGQGFEIAAKNFIANNDLLWASALAYTVMLSIIPVLALVFSVLTGLGGAARVRALINQYLALGSPDITNYIMHFVGNINSATLGSVGAVALLLTVLSTLGTIELAFNTIWQVPEGRGYLRKFADYLSVVFTVPLILAAALTLTAHFSTSLDRVPGMALVVPLAILWIGFFFLFVFFPYTQVNPGAALVGSFLTAMLFQVAQWSYIHFQVGMASYRAIYGALATIPIVLMWIYVAWSIVLFGVELSFAIQRGRTRLPQLADSPSFPRYAALLTLLRLTERFDNPHMIVDPHTLAAEMQSRTTMIDPILRRLKHAGLVIESASGADDNRTPAGLFLSRNPAQIQLADALRAAGINEAPGGDRRVVAAMNFLDEAESARLNTATLRDLRKGIADTEPGGAGTQSASPPSSGPPQHTARPQKANTTP